MGQVCVGGGASSQRNGECGPMRGGEGPPRGLPRGPCLLVSQALPPWLLRGLRCGEGHNVLHDGRHAVAHGLLGDPDVAVLGPRGAVPSPSWVLRRGEGQGCGAGGEEPG